MKAAFGLVLLVIGPVFHCSAARLARASDPAEIVKPSSLPPTDVQDIVFLGPMRPLLVRLRITVDGKPFREVWRQRFDELFAQEDRDRQGRISLTQAERIVADMHGDMRHDLPKSGTKDSALTAGADGKVDRQALLAYAEKTVPPFSVRRRALITQGSSLALFPLLDTDHDQQLSANELNDAERQLRQRDFDDDLVITPRELILDPNAIAAAADPNGAERAVSQDDIPVLLVTSFTTPADIADGLLKRYDHNHDGRLTSSAPGIEISLPLAVMGQLDGNGDGTLEREELLKFADRRADLELPFALGQARAAASRNRQRLSSTAEFRVRKTLLDGYEVKGGEVEINFERDNHDPRQTDAGNFRTADRDNNGYIDLNEAQQNNITAAAFAAMDVDGDGKVVKGEFTPYVDRQNAAAAVRLLLEVRDFGQDLFTMLDSDSDGVLSARELRSAKDILAVYDKNADGTLNGDEIPQRIHFKLVRGVGRVETDASVMPNRAVRSTAKANASGPLWFRKMDRNNDGDLSPQEFVGPLEAFQKLDANRDGLIDKDEAEAASK
ncbi:MAG: hypothetical protein HY288_15990 [Planctomycetia bacterium]|nr:hypothetical protein [Planctomycetia bacterium]